MRSRIPFKWGSTDPSQGLDCFTYASYLSDRTFGKPFDLSLPPIVEAYERYTLETKPYNLMLDLAIALKLPRLSTLEHGSLVLLRSPHSLCLGTVIDGNVAFMGQSVSEVWAIKDIPSQAIDSAWNAEPLRKLDAKI